MSIPGQRGTGDRAAWRASDTIATVRKKERREAGRRGPHVRFLVFSLLFFVV